LFSHNIHQKYIQSVNNLSQRNVGITGKNPSVACLIVDYSDSITGNVISYGLTSKGGSPHAEVNALNKVSKNKITKKTIMYVSLEPCFKEGDCCSKLILKNGIKKIFISSLDPNPLIFNKGIQFLRKNNIKVIHSTKSLDNFHNINKYFHHYYKKKRPFITLKLAISKNSFSKDFKCSNITTLETQYYMHKYRLYHDAIAVGYNTYKEDKPQLNCRLNGIDKKNFKFVISNLKNKLQKFNIIKLDFKDDPKIFLNQLETFKIKSILIEGGLNIFNYFYQNFFFDEIILCKSRNMIKKSDKRYKLNLNLLKKNLKLYSSRTYGNDIIEIYKK
jgi:diaminohydroxyphosphoribosylaminopyrimidine deaminase/5-amino-6-(5-phosphoribosylamino)uracil reductase